jgi:hypothetical protein
MRKELEEQRTRASALLSQGKRKQVVDEFIIASKRDLEGLELLPYRGRPIGEAQGYRDAKTLVGRLFSKVDRIYRGAVPYPLEDLMKFGDADYVVALTQSFDVWGLVERQSDVLDSRLRIWLVLGIYAYQYEFSSKALVSLTSVLTAKPCESSGSALSILKERFGATELEACFDSFLRNAIDHSEFMLKDRDSGKIEAWKTNKKGRVTKEYDVAAVTDMTTRLLFFTIAYVASWHEKVIELERAGRLRLGGY